MVPSFMKDSTPTLVRTIREYSDDARELELDEFVNLHGLGFFVKAPSRPETAPSFDDLTLISVRPSDVKNTVNATFHVLPITPSRGYTSATITVGRLASNDIQIRDKSISRRHAVVRITQDGRFELMDQDSGNGTSIGDTPLKPGEAYAMPSESSVTLGSVQLTFVDAGHLMRLVTKVVRLSSIELPSLMPDE